MFRKSTLQQAHDLNLRGWVRNEPDGSVSGEAAGPTEHVQRLYVSLLSTYMTVVTTCMSAHARLRWRTSM